MNLQDRRRLQWPVYFLVLVAAYLIIGGFFALFIDKGDFELFVNQHHTPFLDAFNVVVTYLGDGLWLGVLAAVFLFVRWHHFVVLALLIITQTLLVHLGKRVLFPGLDRPKNFFEKLDTELIFVEGVKVHGSNTFPSGHTTTAFSIAFFLAWLAPRNAALALLVFTGAMLAGFSRIYLVQHFFVDTYAGTIIGTLSAFLAIWLTGNFIVPADKKEIMERKIRLGRR